MKRALLVLLALILAGAGVVAWTALRAPKLPPAPSVARLAELRPSATRCRTASARPWSRAGRRACSTRPGAG